MSASKANADTGGTAAAPRPFPSLVRPGIEPVPPLVFARLQGQAIGYGFWPALLGAGAIALHAQQGLDELGLAAIVLGFPAGLVIAVALDLVFQQAQPLTGRLRWTTFAAICIPALTAYWLGAPVERWARVPQNSWDEWSFTIVTPALAMLLIAHFNGQATELRFGPGAGTAAKHKDWYDERVRFLRRRVAFAHRLPWISPEARLQARGSLGFALMGRFTHPDGGSLVDVADAIDQFALVVAATPPGAADAATVRFELQRALSAFHEAQAGDADTDELITVMRDVVSALSDRMSPVDHGLALSTFCMYLAQRYIYAVRNGTPLGEEAAAEVRRELDRLETLSRQDGLPDWLAARMLTVIGQFHVVLPVVDADGSALGDAQRLTELDHGIGVLGQALPKAATGNKATLGAVRAYLALGLATRYRLRRDRDPDTEPGTSDAEFTGPADVADLTTATEQVLRALSDPGLRTDRPGSNLAADLATAVMAARDCVDAEIARGRWDTALRVAGPALAATGQVVAGSVFDVNIYQAVGFWQGLHDSAAYATARHPAGGRQPADVAALIEWGRALRLSAGLAGAHPDKALPAGVSAQDRAAWVALAKHAKEIEAIQWARDRRNTMHQEGQLRDEQIRVNRSMREIRSRMTGAMAPTSPTQHYLPVLAAAAAEAPLCYLIHLPATRVGHHARLPGLAVLVQPPRGPEPPEISVLHLPLMTGAAVADWTRRWTTGTHAARPRDVDRPHRRTDDHEDAVDELLRDLGAAVMTPVLEAAGQPDRLVLLPDGVLGLLPLHAALVPGPDGSPPRPACLDTVISYAPSAAVLNLCRTAARAPHADAGPGESTPRFPTDFLGVAVPPSQLRGAEPEVTTCASFFQHSTLLTGPQAQPVPDRVLRRLDARPRGTRVVHLACHGYVDPRDPLNSALKLVSRRPTRSDPPTPQPEYAGVATPSATAPDMLTIADVWRVNLTGTRLAMLSACHSGAPAASQPGEFTSLATGFIRSGVPGVVSTLAQVYDHAARIVACRFYQEWRHRPTDPAAALSATQRWLATTPPDEITAWAYHRAAWFDCTPEQAAHLSRTASWAAFYFTGI